MRGTPQTSPVEVELVAEENKCKMCGATFPNPQALMQHVEKAHGK